MPFVHHHTVLHGLHVIGADILSVADIVVGRISKANGMVVVDFPVPSEVGKIVFHVILVFLFFSMVPNGRCLQLFVCCFYRLCVIVCQVTSNEEVHTVP